MRVRCSSTWITKCAQPTRNLTWSSRSTCSNRADMSLQSPPIDSRTQDDILAQVQALAPFYTPEWDATQQTGAGAALMEIFADLVDGLIQRLNQVPNNNLIAFLNMLGVQLL